MLAMGTVPLRCQQLGKRFASDAWAVRNLSLDVPAGALVLLAGANGSGKTTLLRMLAGALAPDTGSLEIAGAVATVPRSAAQRQAVTLIAQEPALDPDMTPRQLLEFFGTLAGLPAGLRRDRMADVAQRLDLGAFLDRPVARLSGGQRMRTHLAMGLVPNSDILLLDEPTAALDPDTQQRLWRQLSVYCAQGGTCVAASHDLRLAQDYCTHVAVLARGELLAWGERSQLCAQHQVPDVAQLYSALVGETVVAAQPARGRGTGGGRGRGLGAGL